MNPLLPIEYLILITVTTLTVSGWCGWKSAIKSPRHVRIAVVSLRLAGFFSLAIIAMNPGYWYRGQIEQNGEWAILLDSSLSMGTFDVKSGSRWDEARRITGKILSSTTDRKFRLFAFSSRLDALESEKQLSELKCDGDTTDIIGAGKKVLELFHSGTTRLEGIILLSDGRQVEQELLSDFAAKARSLQVSVFPIVIGGKIESQDLAISGDRGQYIAFKGQPLKITATLTSRNLENISPVVRLLDGTGKQISEQKVKLGAQSSTRVEFEMVSDQLGYHPYTLKVDSWEGESLLRNNSSRVGLFILESKIRVLMAEGMPYWDSKFIAQLLQKQKNIQLTTIYRLSVDKYFSLDEDSSSAPQPIFPQDEASFRKYDLIVFGKGIEYFLNPEKIRLLERFVAERGGGLIFARGKPYHNKLAELENLEPVEWGDLRQGDFRWQPTIVGKEAGLFKEALPGVDDAVWQNLPPLTQAWECSRIKGFAQVLAEGAPTSANSHRFPTVFSQRFGKGLIVAVNSEDLWKWDFFPSYQNASKIYRDFWGQLFQWIVTHSEFLPGQDYSLRLSDTSVSVNQPIIAKVAIRGERSAKAPIIRVLDEKEVMQEFTLAPSPTVSNEWEGFFSMKQAGTYRVEMKEDGSKDSLPLYETLEIRPAPSEKDDISTDPEFLEAIAAQTGGRLMDEENLIALLQNTPRVPTGAADENAQWKSFWDRGWLLALILFFFALEWFIRRRNGLI